MPDPVCEVSENERQSFSNMQNLLDEAGASEEARGQFPATIEEHSCSDENLERLQQEQKRQELPQQPYHEVAVVN